MTDSLSFEQYQSLIAPSNPLALSVVIPIYNEVASIPHLVDAVATSLSTNQLSYEIVCVDDGSQDGSTELLLELARSRPDLKAVILRRNYGQTAAMSAGFKHAQGRVIVKVALL